MRIIKNCWKYELSAPMIYTSASRVNIFSRGRKSSNTGEMPTRGRIVSLIMGSSMDVPITPAREVKITKINTAKSIHLLLSIYFNSRFKAAAAF